MYTDVTETCRSHQPPFTLESPTCLTRSGGPQALGSSCGSMNLLSSEEIWSGGAILDVRRVKLKIINLKLIKMCLHL